MPLANRRVDVEFSLFFHSLFLLHLCDFIQTFELDSMFSVFYDFMDLGFNPLLIPFVKLSHRVTQN